MADPVAVGVDPENPVLPPIVVAATASGPVRAVAGADAGSFMTPADTAEVLPYEDIRWHGATPWGAEVSTSAFNAAIAAAVARNATAVLIPAGIWAIDGEVTVPNSISLMGEGTCWNNASDGAIVHCRPGGKISVEGGGGLFGNFTIDGGDLATGPLLHRKLGAERPFTAMHIRRSAGIAWQIDQAQNDIWTNIHVTGAVDHCLVIDQGAGGNKFQSCEFNACDGWHLLITETTGTGPYVTSGPSHNTFDHCLFERALAPGAGPFQGIVDVQAGSNNALRDCVLSASGYGTAVAVIRTNVVAPATGTVLELASTQIWGSTAAGSGLGILQTSGAIYVTGRLIFQQLIDAWKMDGGQCYVAGRIAYSGVTNRFHAGAALSPVSIRNVQTRPLFLTELDTNDSIAVAIARNGDTFQRVNIAPTGTINWGSGTAATDTNLYRYLANVLRTDDKFTAGLGIGVGNSVAASGLGNVVRKMEVFDQFGNSIGFVPIYDTIT